MIMSKDIVCPFCLKRLKQSQLVQVCTLNPAHRKPEKRGLFGSSRDDCREPGCRGRYANVLCPHCGEQLPSNIAQYQSYSRLAIAAPSRGGKTVLITTMLHEVFSNATLADMAVKRPHNHAEFLQVSGVGEVKAARYGDAFLNAIREWEERNGA